MTGSPIACDLTMLDPEQREQHTRLSDELFEGAEEVRELEDGYAFQYRADDTTWMKLAEFVDGERRCCPFFRFTLVMEAEGAAIWLHMTGREGVKEFLKAEMDQG